MTVQLAGQDGLPGRCSATRMRTPTRAPGRGRVSRRRPYAPRSAPSIGHSMTKSPQRPGTTTFARALAADIPREERIVTAENEYELFLHTLPHRHADIVAMEAREANAEGLGGITVRELVTDALRLNAKRIIVGEVLGDELVPMLVAMNTGGEGSLCTIHADTAEDLP